MTSFEVAATIVCLAAALGYVNARILRLPSAIGLMAMALLGSFCVLGLGSLGAIDEAWLEQLVAKADFADVLLHNMLGLMLFAGALHVDLKDLSANKWPIAALALGGTLLSTLIVGSASFLLMRALDQDLGLVNAFLFGALISPTDPIAVLGILKSARAPAELSVQISGESLFNDGIGVVVFLAISMVANGGDVTTAEVAGLFGREALGGAAFGLAVGYVGYQLLRRIDDYSVEVLITLALVLGGYAGAERLHVSAPIAAVLSGLLVGNQGRRLAMSDATRQHVDMFWELVDEILNAVLFLMLGLLATRLTVSPVITVAAALVIPLVLGARFVSVALAISGLRLRIPFTKHAVKLLTWGGLRGGISVALALSLPEGVARDRILVLTYAVVAFSILVQGLSLGRVLRRLGASSPLPSDQPAAGS